MPHVKVFTRQEGWIDKGQPAGQIDSDWLAGQKNATNYNHLYFTHMKEKNLNVSFCLDIDKPFFQTWYDNSPPKKSNVCNLFE